MSRRLFAFLLGLTVIVVPASAGAKVGAILPDCVNTGNCGLDDFVEMFSNAYGWGLSILGALALFFFVYGGFTWLIAAGNQERIERGKKILENTLIGVVIGLTSWMIVNVVIAFLVTPPGETVDFTGTRVLGRPWWNFWGDLPVACCVTTGGCILDTTRERCEQSLSGQWKDGQDCTAVDECKQGCCVPEDLATEKCADISFGSCAAGFTYVPGATCDAVSKCRGCCVKTTPEGNICTNEENSMACTFFSSSPCAANDPRCPSDPAGCCVQGATCTDNVREHDCSIPPNDGFFALQSCQTLPGCP